MLCGMKYQHCMKLKMVDVVLDLFYGVCSKINTHIIHPYEHLMVVSVMVSLEHIFFYLLTHMKLVEFLEIPEIKFLHSFYMNTFHIEFFRFFALSQ